MTYHKNDRQVRFQNTVLHFDKIMPLFVSFNLLTIDTRQYVRSAIHSILMKGFSLNLTQMFTSTGQCAEPILPLHQVCEGHWWGYESHSVAPWLRTFTNVTRQSKLQKQSCLPTYETGWKQLVLTWILDHNLKESQEVMATYLLQHGKGG